MKLSEKVKALLKSKDLKITPARQAIVEAFFKAKKPLHVGNLKKIKGLEETNESSFYRNIQKLIDAEILHMVPSSEEHKLYELIAENKHHHHIVCTKCKEVSCLTDCTIGSQLSKMAAKAGFTVSSHSLELYGLCRSCQ